MNKKIVTISTALLLFQIGAIPSAEAFSSSSLSPEKIEDASSFYSLKEGLLADLDASQKFAYFQWNRLYSPQTEGLYRQALDFSPHASVPLALDNWMSNVCVSNPGVYNYNGYTGYGAAPAYGVPYGNGSSEALLDLADLSCLPIPPPPCYFEAPTVLPANCFGGGGGGGGWGGGFGGGGFAAGFISGGGGGGFSGGSSSHGDNTRNDSPSIPVTPGNNPEIAVPEPSTWLLLGSMIAMAIGFKKRSAKNKEKI